MNIYVYIGYIITILIFLYSCFKKRKNKKIVEEKYKICNDKKFEQIFNKILENKDFEELKELRKKAKLNNSIRSKINIITYILFIIYIISFFILSEMKANLVIVFAIYIPFFIIIFLSIVITNKLKPVNADKVLKSDFQEKIISTFIKEYNSSYVYSPKAGIEQSIYEEANFEHFCDYKSEDLIEGYLNNKSHFCISEVITKVDTDDGMVTKFSGIFFETDLLKRFKEILYIRYNASKLAKVFTDFRPSYYDLKIELDSSEFESIYDVYSSNKIVAMQLLTPDIMQMLLDFKNELAVSMELSLENNCLYMRFGIGEVFEPSLDIDSLRASLFKYYRLLNLTLELAEEITKLIYETEYD